MPEVKPTDKPLYWAVESDGVIGVAGIAEVGSVTATKHTVHFDTDENIFCQRFPEREGLT